MEGRVLRSFSSIKKSLGFFHFLEIVLAGTFRGQKIPVQSGWYLPPHLPPHKISPSHSLKTGFFSQVREQRKIQRKIPGSALQIIEYIFIL
jgi:hypothetical protein